MSTPTYTLEQIAPHIVRLSDDDLYTAIAYGGWSTYSWYQWSDVNDERMTVLGKVVYG